MAIVLPKFPRRGLSGRIPTANQYKPAIMIRLVGLQPCYEPNETLEFEYRLGRWACDKVSAIETSVVWYTEGKGTEDLGVHFFERNSGQTVAQRDWQAAQHIETKLPAAPLSYEGRLLKIRWSIRVRAFLNDGTELIAQQPFYLGSLTREV